MRALISNARGWCLRDYFSWPNLHRRRRKMTSQKGRKPSFQHWNENKLFVSTISIRDGSKFTGCPGPSTGGRRIFFKKNWGGGGFGGEDFYYSIWKLKISFFEKAYWRSKRNIYSVKRLGRFHWRINTCTWIGFPNCDLKGWFWTKKERGLRFFFRKK